MAAENSGTRRVDSGGFRASMRPRRMAAENSWLPIRTCRPPRGFNEAAANGRGKLGPLVIPVDLDVASMRPRRMAAENAEEGSGAVTGRGDASMRPRRMAAENASACSCSASSAAGCFNEAAANGRGKQTDSRKASARMPASMRPRRMAAENAGGEAAAAARTGASMRPRRMAAENIVQRPCCAASSRVLQ